MAEWFLRALLVTTLAGTLLTVVLTLLKPITKRLFGYSWHYYIWLMVLLVMVLPVRFSLPERQLKPTLAAQSTQEQMAVPEENTATAEYHGEEQMVPNTPAPTPIQKNAKMLTGVLFDKTDMLFALWLFGVCVLLFITVFGYVRLVCRVRKRVLWISCPNVANYTKRTLRVGVYKGFSSPFIMGIFRPVLLLPEIDLTDAQLENILRHEITHLNRNDILYKWFAAFVKILHWFNPFVYYVVKNIHTECEISCDLSVIRDMEKEQELSYIDTILFLLSKNKQKNISLTTGMTGSKNSLKRRFMMMKQKKRTNKLISACSAVVAAVMLGTTVFAGGVLSDFILEDYKIELMVNQESVVLENRPFIENGEVYFPLREAYEKIGVMSHPDSAIEWENGKIYVTVAEYRGGTYVTQQHKQFGADAEVVTFISDYALEIGKPVITMNVKPNLIGQDISRPYEIRNAPILKNGVTYVPYEAFHYLLAGTSYSDIGYKVYDKANNLLVQQPQYVEWKPAEPLSDNLAYERNPNYSKEQMACYGTIDSLDNALLQYDVSGAKQCFTKRYAANMNEDLFSYMLNGKIWSVHAIYLFSDGDYRVEFSVYPTRSVEPDTQRVFVAIMQKQENGTFLIDNLYEGEIPHTFYLE